MHPATPEGSQHVNGPVQPESTVRISARERPFLCHPMRSYDALRKVS